MRIHCSLLVHPMLVRNLRAASLTASLAACLAASAPVVLFSQGTPTSTSIQLFSPVNVRASAAGTGYGAAAVNFNSNTLNLSCPASGISAVLSSTADSTGKLLVDNNINVTVAAGLTVTGPTNVCVGGVNGSSIGIPFQNCFASGYEFPPAGVIELGQDPDNLLANGGIPPIDISKLLVAGPEQVTISLQDEGFFLAGSTIYLNTNCTQTGVTGPALVSGNAISGSNPTPAQVSQDFSFNPVNGQQIGFAYDLSAALAAGSLSITDGTIPEVGDMPLDPALYQSAYTPGTSFATSSCLIHAGEQLPNGNPACKLYTLECKVGTGAAATGAQCPISSLPNELFQDQFDGPAFTLSDIPTPGGPTFHEGIGLLMAKEGWLGGPCIFDPASGLEGQDCPQNLLTSFTSVAAAPQSVRAVHPPSTLANPAARAKLESSLSAHPTPLATSSTSSGSYSSGGRTTRPNSTFLTVVQIPEDLTSVSVAGQNSGYWINSPTATVSLSSIPPNLTGTNLPGAATFVPSPIQSITYGLSSATAVPTPGESIPTDLTLTNGAGCPTPANPGTPIAAPFAPPAVTLSGLANGYYLLHYYAQDCAGTQELKFNQDSAGNWSTNFYTYPINVDTVAPAVSGLTLTPPASGGHYTLGQPLSASYSCTDNLSGVVRCGTQAYTQGTTATGTITTPIGTLSPGVKTFSVQAIDAAGNQSTASVNYQVVGSYDTQIQLTFSPAAVTYPQGTTAIIKLLAGSNPTHAPTGTVQLMDGLTPLASVPLQGSGGGTATSYDYLPALSAGSHSITVKYSGDASNPAGLSAPVTLTVTAAPVSILASCVNPAIPNGTNYSCSIYTKPVAAGAAGAITYTYDGGAPISATLASGSTSFSIARPTVGPHTVVVSYPAQGNYAAATPLTLHFTVVASK
jgi:hypothetical protein